MRFLAFACLCVCVCVFWPLRAFAFAFAFFGLCVCVCVFWPLRLRLRLRSSLRLRLRWLSTDRDPRTVGLSTDRDSRTVGLSTDRDARTVARIAKNSLFCLFFPSSFSPLLPHTPTFSSRYCQDCIAGIPDCLPGFPRYFMVRDRLPGLELLEAVPVTYFLYAR